MNRLEIYRADGFNTIESDVKCIFNSLKKNFSEMQEVGNEWNITILTDNFGIEHIRISKTLSVTDEHNWEVNEYSGDVFPLESNDIPQTYSS